MTVYQFIGRIVIFISFIVAPSYTYAACKENDVMASLQAGGFTFSSIETSSDNLIGVKITKDGLETFLYVDRDDGDISFRKYFTDDVRLATLNSINLEYKYIKLSRDEDDDIKVAYDYPYWGKNCSTELTNNIRLWYTMLDAMLEKITQRL